MRWIAIPTFEYKSRLHRLIYFIFPLLVRGGGLFLVVCLFVSFRVYGIKGTLHLQWLKDKIWFCVKLFSSMEYPTSHRLDTESHRARWESVRRDVHLTGTYDLTETELTFGAKLAWRNSARCIGRIQWAKLQVSSDFILRSLKFLLLFVKYWLEINGDSQWASFFDIAETSAIVVSPSSP